MTKSLRKAAEQWLKDRSTLRRTQERTDIDFTVKWRGQAYAKHIPHPLQNSIKNQDKTSGILLIDATFTKTKGRDRAIMIAYDTGVGVIDYWIDCTENKTAYSYLFQRLDKANYKPICVVSDGHYSILPIIEERNLPHQRCLFHLLRTLRGMLMQDGNWIKPKDHVLYSRIKGINHIENLSERVRQFRKFECLFLGRKEVFEWFWDILAPGTLHLSYSEDVPRTTALLENLNGQIKARLKTFRGVKSEKSLNNLLKILFHFHKYKF